MGEVFTCFDFDTYGETGQVDYVLGAEPGGGVFVVARNDGALPRSYMRYYCEAFRLPSLRRDQIDRAVVATGTEEPARVCADGGTAIAFVGHLGNFDLAAAWSARHLTPVTTVAERLEPEEVFQEFVAFRNSIDMDIIPLTGGDDPLASLLRVASVHYEKAPVGEGLGGYRTVIRMGPALTPRVDGTTAQKAQDLIQQCADHLAETIREHTSSWHMLQRVFVEDLDERNAPDDRDDARADSRPGSA